MNHMTISEFRANLPKAFETVRKTDEPMIVTQGTKRPLLVIPLDYMPLAELAARFFPQPRRMPLSRLDESIQSLERGDVVRMSLDDLRTRAKAAMKAQKNKKRRNA